MKKNRIIQRTVSAFLAAAMLATLASCDAKLPGSRNNTDGFTNQPRQIMNYYTSEMLAVPDGFGYAQNIFCNDENIFIYGGKSNDSAEILSGIYDFGAKELKELNLSDLNADYISSAAYIGKDLAVSYWESETNSQKITIFDTASSKVKCSADINQNSYISSLSVNADSELVAVIEEWGPAAQKYFVKKYDPATLEEKSSNDITKAIEVGDNGYLTGVEFDKAGDMYSLITEHDKEGEPAYKLVKFKEDGTIVYTNEDFADLKDGGMVIKRANGNICVLSSVDGGVTLGIDEIDNLTGDIKERYNVKLSEDISGVCLNSGEADFIYSDSEGVWKLDFDKEKPEKIISYGTEVPESYSCVQQMSYSDGKLFLYGQDWGGESSLIYKFDKEGTFVGEFPVESPGKNSYITSISADKDGKIVAISEEHGYSEDGTDETTCYIYEIKEDGSIGDKTALKIDTDGNCYMERVEKTSSGDYAAVVYTDGGEEQSSFVQIFSASGEKKAVITDGDIENIDSYYSTPSGDYICYRDKSGKTIYRKVDNTTYELGDTVELNIPEGINRINSDGNYDMCYSDSSGIYGYSFAENKSTEIVNWIDSDIVFSVWNASFLGSDKIVCQGYDYSSGEEQIYVLKRADDETLKKIQNKKLVTIAGVGVGYNSAFKEKVVDFNRNSNEYRLQVNDYQKFSKYEDDTYNSGAFQLNNDLASGNVPDILVGSSEVNMTSFAAKNILADLTTYFENDADIKREDYFENILDLGKYKGKLCQVFAGFSISALAGPESKLGKEANLTHEDLFALKKNGNVFYEKTSRERLVNELLKANLAEYVDFENKTCDFDNERFSGILDLVTEEGSEADEEELYAKEDMMNGELEEVSRFKDNKCQLDLVDIYNFSPLLELLQGALGEAATIKGYPSENGSGIVILPNMTFAICEKSKNKDAAWDFIREFFTEEYQNEMNGEYISTFPVRKSSFDDVIAKGKKKESYQYYQVTKPDGSYAEMKPLDDATAEKFRKAVESADRCVLSDERIEKIIDEAIDQVKNGEKTSSEAAADIQKKVSTYLNEIK